MNSSLIDQIAKYISKYKVVNQNIYLSDQDTAKVFADVMLMLIQTHMCQNSKDGYCEFFWKHDACYELMNISYRLTMDEKYIPKWGSYS